MENDNIAIGAGLFLLVAIGAFLLIPISHQDDIYFLNAGSNSSNGCNDLDCLNDVIIASPSTNQTIIYNGTHWINLNPSGSCTTFNCLFDVVIVSPSSGHIILYNGTHWLNKSVSGDITITANGVVTISNNAVNSAKISDGTVTGTDIASDTIGDSNIATHTSTKITIANKAQLNSAILYYDAVNNVGSNTVEIDTSANRIMIFKSTSSSASTTARDIVINAFGGPIQWKCQRANGSSGSETVLVANDVFCATQGQGWDGSGYQNGANFRYVATGTWSGTNRESKIELRVVPTGSTTVTNGIIINQDSTVDIGANSRLKLSESGLTAVRTKTFEDRTATVADIGKQDLWVGIGTNCGGLTITTGVFGATGNAGNYIKMDGASDTAFYCDFPLPRNYDSGTIKLTYYWNDALSGSTNSAVFQVSGVAIGDGATFDNPTFGTAVKVTDASNGQNKLNISAQTASITLAGTPTDGKMITLKIERLASSDANDNLTDEIEMLGFLVEYNTDSGVVA